MSSAVYFKFKASLKQYTIPFDGSAISVKDLRNAIRLSCGLKSTDFELQILDKQGKDYAKEDDLIPKFSDLIVRRLPKANDPPKKKIANPEDMTRRDPYKAINSLPKINLYGNSINLAKSNIPDDEKLDIMTKRCSEEYSEKNYLVKPKPYGVPPASYVCNKCHQGGHWIHECPGLRDRDGKLLDFKSVKRPTGIPQDFLLEVAPGTPGAYLTKEGKYMVPIKDAEAYAMGKKEKRPFSIEENPPYIVKDEELPSKLKCLLCCKLLENPTCTPCCSSVFCAKCISEYLYDPEVNGNRECPSCLSLIENHESLVDNELLRQLIQCWKANMLTKEIVDSCLLSTVSSNNRQSSPSSVSAINKKTELNEDSRKSPEMKFNSANDDNDSGGSNVTVKTEKEKVFVNNRRVLKPKISSKGIIGDNSPAMTNETMKVESVENSEKDQDVNDLIFEQVQYSEMPEIKTEAIDSKTVKATKPSGKDDINLKIEIIAKRSDGGTKNCDRKQSDGKYRSNDHMKMSTSKNNNDCIIPQHNFSTIINPGLDSNSQLLNHFPSSNHIVSSVQQQMMEPIQWPLVNPLYNNIPLQTMFGAALNTVNAVSANWISNGLNLQPAIPINTNTRLLTKEEFYERQRRLRAEKLKHRFNSRSPSGSQSPRRSHHKSKYEDDYQHRHSKRRDSSSSRFKSKTKDDSKEKYSVKKSHSSRQRDAPKSADRKAEFPINASDIKTIDPKLMQDSIKTFLKYLTANPDEIVDNKTDGHRQSGSTEKTAASSVVADAVTGATRPGKSLQHESHRSRRSSDPASGQDKSRHIKKTSDPGKTTVPSDHQDKAKKSTRRRSTRSRSVPKTSKDRLADCRGKEGDRCLATGTIKKEEEDRSSPRKRPATGQDNGHRSRRKRHHQEDDADVASAKKRLVPLASVDGDKTRTPQVSMAVVHKSVKKSKHRHHHHQSPTTTRTAGATTTATTIVDDATASVRKSKKHHKKHKQKKTKKSKRTKRDTE